MRYALSEPEGNDNDQGSQPVAPLDSCGGTQEGGESHEGSKD